MSIRFKLTVIAVAVILVANTLLSFVTMHYLSYAWLDEVQRRVRRNLNSARAAYRKQVDTTAAFLQAAALDGNLAAAVAQGDRARIRGVLGRLHRSRPMDFITLLDSKCTVISRAAGDRRGDSLAEDPLVARLLAEPQVTGGTVIFSQERLEAEGGGLAERARFEVIETPAARPTRDKVRSEGMVLAAAAPVFDEAGNLLAVLYGGDLINRRYQMVDGIKREVFPDEVYRGKDIGTVTIFQGDLRIPMPRAQRLIGARSPSFSTSPTTTRWSRPCSSRRPRGAKSRWWHWMLARWTTSCSLQRRRGPTGSSSWPGKTTLRHRPEWRRLGMRRRSRRSNRNWYWSVFRLTTNGRACSRRCWPQR